MSGIGDLLAKNRDELFDLWEASERKALSADSMTREDLLDTLPALLDFIVLRLGQAERGEEQGYSTLPRRHGTQRFELGFDLVNLVRDYSTLRQCILKLAQDHGFTSIDAAEYAVVENTISFGITEALIEYVRCRDRAQEEEVARYIGFLSHELRSPIGTGLLALQLMADKEDVPWGPELERVKRSLEQLRDMVEHALLQVSSRNRGLSEQVLLDVGALVQQIAEDRAELARARGLELKSYICSDIFVEGDRRLLWSAVGNLVNNAIKFSRPGSDVVVRVRRAPDTPRARVEVEDSCGGLPEGAIRRMFDPFTQLGTNRSGFGLGLAIAREAVSAHSGLIHAQSLPGKGCIFVLELPLSGADI